MAHVIQIKSNPRNDWSSSTEINTSPLEIERVRSPSSFSLPVPSIQSSLFPFTTYLNPMPEKRGVGRLKSRNNVGWKMVVPIWHAFHDRVPRRRVPFLLHTHTHMCTTWLLWLNDGDWFNQAEIWNFSSPSFWLVQLFDPFAIVLGGFKQWNFVPKRLIRNWRRADVLETRKTTRSI